MIKLTILGSLCEMIVVSEIQPYQLQIYREGVLSEHGRYGQPTEGVGRLRFTVEFMRDHFIVHIHVNPSIPNNPIISNTQEATLE